jgi:hypothetical protein
MTKPSDVAVSINAPFKPSGEPKPQAEVKHVKPSSVPVAKRKSEPVRNPAFREHAGLRELQKQLNSQRFSSRKSK